MATAYFMNATTAAMAVNLNNNLETNHEVDPFVVGDPDQQNVVTIQFCCWGANIQAYPVADVYGGNGAANSLVVFRQTATTPVIYTIRSDQSVTLDLYFYITGGAIYGVDATGTTTGITIETGAEDIVVAQLPRPSFVTSCGPFG